MNSLPNMNLNSSEEKLDWITNEVEELCIKADKMISSGLANSVPDSSFSNPILLTNQTHLPSNRGMNDSPRREVQLKTTPNWESPNNIKQAESLNESLPHRYQSVSRNNDQNQYPTRPNNVGPVNDEFIRSTITPGNYNEFLSCIFKDAVVHDCSQRINCADKSTVYYTEAWFGNRSWFIIDKIRTIGYGDEEIFDLPKYKNMCGAQKRRIAYLLGSPNI